MGSVQFRVWRKREWKSDVGLIVRTNTWREDESEISADWGLLQSPFPSPFSVTCCRPNVLMCFHPLPAPSSCEQWRQRFSPVSFRVCPWMLPLRLTNKLPCREQSCDDIDEEWHDNRWLHSQDKHVPSYANQCATTQRTSALRPGHNRSTSCYQISHPRDGTVRAVKGTEAQM